MKKQALISVFKKDGIVDFAKELSDKYNYEILSTGGTARLLKENNIPVTEVSERTKFPEMLEGRVKTLHPVVHGGILARRDKEDHMQSIEKMDIKPIDMVVINLYPFEEITSKPSSTLEESIEMIDIGGPSMIRSAAKNYAAVTVVSDPEDLKDVLKELDSNEGSTTLDLRQKLAAKAFKKTSEYDANITKYLSAKFNNGASTNGKHDSFPQDLNLSLKLKNTLRYGENPHQKAAIYLPSDSSAGLANAEVIQGKELSFNNYLDLDSAWNIASEFDAKTPAAVIIKHNNPCGVAIAPNYLHAYIEALNCDPVSAFGGIVAFNGRVEKDVAEELVKIFLEAIIAPDYSPEALEVLKKKAKVRVLKVSPKASNPYHYDIKRVGEGYLVQDFNSDTLIQDNLKVATKRKPTEAEMIDLIFAWKICKHVKSNAILLAKEGKTIGIGPGQCNRVGSVDIALKQADINAEGSVLASDAFFPFKDSIETAASARVSAIIQPGGSIRDEEVIEACDKNNIAMVLTGMRHFRH